MYRDVVQVEAISTLLLEEILKIMPKNPYAFAADFLKRPSNTSRITNFKRSNGFLHYDLIDRDAQLYAIDGLMTNGKNNATISAQKSWLETKVTNAATDSLSHCANSRIPSFQRSKVTLSVPMTKDETKQPCPAASTSASVKSKTEDDEEKAS